MTDDRTDAEQLEALAFWHMEAATEAARLVRKGRSPWMIEGHRQRAAHHAAADALLTRVAEALKKDAKSAS